MYVNMKQRGAAMDELAVISPAGLSKPETVDGLLERFLLAHDVRATSRAAYRAGLRRFMRWIEERRVINPSREHIVEYKAHLEAEGLSPRTRSLYITALRGFFRWAEGERLYRNIADGVKGPKIKKDRWEREALTFSQAVELLGAVDRTSSEGLRDYALLSLLLSSGLRTIEAIRADVGDVKQEGGIPVIAVHGKGRDSKDEVVPLTDEALRHIRAYLSARAPARDEEPLFVSLSDRNKGGRLTTRTIRRLVGRALQAIGIRDPRLSAHSLRHTYAILNLESGASMDVVQALMRHESSDTTRIYTRSIERRRKLQGAPRAKIDALLWGANS